MIPPVEDWHPVLVALFAGVVGASFSMTVTIAVPWAWRKARRLP